jgi:DNA-binding MarR family transcriptional regulator
MTDSSSQIENPQRLEQARFLFEAIRVLRDQMARTYACRLKENPEVACWGDLTFTQCTTLMVVRDHGKISLKTLAEALNVSPGSTSVMVDKLVEMGMLERAPNPNDRREIEISLSERGAQALEVMESVMLSGLMELLEKVGPEVGRQWCSVYEQLLRALGRDPQNLTQQNGTHGDRIVRLETPHDE